MTAKRRRSIAAQLDRAAAACARDGAQLTELRCRVLGLVLEADGPVTAYQLLDRLRKIHKGAGRRPSSARSNSCWTRACSTGSGVSTRLSPAPKPAIVMSRKS